MKCKNCNEELLGQEKFCSNCGQKNIDRLNLKYILSQFVEDVFNVDSKVFRTLKNLITKPGYLTKEYIEGRRSNYIPPVRLYIVMSVLFFFILSLIDYDEKTSTGITVGEPTQDEVVVDGVKFSINGETITIPTEDLKRLEYEGRLDEGLDSLTADMPEFAAYVSRKMAKTKINDEGFLDILSDQFSLFLMLFLPFFALLYATIFSGNKKGFIGHLIFNLHLNSFVMFSLILTLLVDLCLPNNDTVEFAWVAIVFLFGQYYILKAIMKFYERKWWAALYKYSLLIVGYVILALVFVILVFATSILLL